MEQMRVRASGLSTRQLWALLIGAALGAATVSYSDTLIGGVIGTGLWVGVFVAVAFWIEQKTRKPRGGGG